MLRLLFGVFVTLHGLVQLWFVALTLGSSSSNRIWAGRASPGSYSASWVRRRPGDWRGWFSRWRLLGSWWAGLL